MLGRQSGTRSILNSASGQPLAVDPEKQAIFRDNSRSHISFDCNVNPHLAQLQPYPFEKLRALFAGITPNPQYKEIKLSIGEPQHPTPPFIMEALANGLKGLANYPTTQGIPALRNAVAAWCSRRYGLELNPETEILPVNGSREALFSFAQTVIDPSEAPP